MRTFLLSVLASAILLCAHAQDETFTLNGVTYEITGDATVGVSETDTELAEIIVPETVNNAGTTYTVTSVETYAFNYSKATKVVLPNTVTEIKYSGMYGAGEVNDLTLPAGLKKLGDFAFAYCRKLTSVTLPESIEHVSASCFASCETLENVTLPSTIKSIGNGAFYKTALKEFTFPAACDSVGNNLFQNCHYLTKITLNENIRVLGTGTFRDCELLSSVNMEVAKKLETLPDNLFLNDIALTEITIPAGVKQFGVGPFAGTGISSFKLADGNTGLVIINEAVYSADKYLLYAFPPKSTTQEVVVADGCRGISGGAFDGTAVEKVTLPESMRAFDDNAFMNTPLKEMNFPPSLVFMGAYALANTGFTEITLPENMTFIEEGLLAQCPNLTSVTIPAAIRSIGMYAFRQSEKLAEVHCLGVEPPALDYYESYEYPFYQISSEAVLSVPKGTIEAYEQAGYTDFKSIVDTEAAAFTPTSTTPDYGAELKTLERVSLTFAEDVIIVKNNPDIDFRKGSELSGTPIKPDNQWLAVKGDDSKTVDIVALDYDGYTMSFSLEAGIPYYFSIPAGVFKNAAGDANQPIVIAFSGKRPAPFTYESVNPADGAELEEITAVELTFAHPVSIVTDAPAIEWGISTAKTTPATESGWSVADMSEDGKTMTLTPDAPLSLEGAANYRLYIPAGVFEDAEGNTNSAITLTYKGRNNTGISHTALNECVILTRDNGIEVQLGSLSNCRVQLYHANGMLIEDVKQATGSIVFNTEATGMYIINITLKDATQAFKVTTR